MAQAARHEGWLAKRRTKITEEKKVHGVTAIDKTGGNIYIQSVCLATML